MTRSTLTRTLGVATVVAGIGLATGVSAVTLNECRRITHVSHGGEARHRDLGEGQVAWLSWWSQEGVQETIVLADCATKAGLRTVTRSENMNRDLPFDRTDRAVEAIERMVASPVMRGFDQIAQRLSDLRLTPEHFTLAAEPCACAALYPALRGDTPAFEMEVL